MGLRARDEELSIPGGTCYGPYMRTPRHLLVAASLLALAACKAAPPERFLEPRTGIAVVVPSLQTFGQQARDVLDTAESFPHGRTIGDLRALAKGRLGFDPLDAKGLEGAGIDPKRGLAVGVDDADVVVVVPVKSKDAFARWLDGLAVDLKLKTRSEGLPAKAGEGAPAEDKVDAAIVHWSIVEGEPVLSYGFAEKNAVVGFGPGAAARVKKALHLDKTEHVGTVEAFQAAREAVGPGQAAFTYFSPDLPVLQEMKGAQGALSLGFSGAKDRLTVVMTSPRVSDATPARADTAPFLAKLHPAETLVINQGVDLTSTFDREKLAAQLASLSGSEATKQTILDAVGALGGGAAFGVGLVSPADASKALPDAPLAFFRAEAVVGLRDAAKMKEVLARVVAEVGADKLVAGPEGTWRAVVAGGEVGLAVQPKQLLLAAGPQGALDQLTGRSGTRFEPPTPTAKKAFAGAFGGLYFDLARFAGQLKALPASAYGGGSDAAAAQAIVGEVADALARIRAVSVGTEMKGKVQRAELVIEVQATK